jgi:predicted metal-dependent phosphoesterase TrpH
MSITWQKGNSNFDEKINPEISFDFHIHSCYSADSLSSPESITKLARKRGLNVVAITDHNTIKGGLKARSVDTDGLNVIIGAEINTEFGDLIGIFLNNEIISRDFGGVIDEIRDQDGLVVLPHPYRRKRFPSNELLKYVDIFEGLNARTLNDLNLKAEKLAVNLRKPMICGSDAHFLFELGVVRNVVKDMPVYEEGELRKKILRGDVRMYAKSRPSIMRKTSIVLGTAVKKLKKSKMEYG